MFINGVGEFILTLFWLSNPAFFHQIVGLNTNIDFLLSLSGHPEFEAGNVSTSFIPQHYADLFPAPRPPCGATVCQAALGLLLQEKTHVQEFTEASTGERTTTPTMNCCLKITTGELLVVVVFFFFFVFLDPFSPFGSSSGWRNNVVFIRNMTLQVGDKSKFLLYCDSDAPCWTGTEWNLRIRTVFLMCRILEQGIQRELGNL